MICYYCSNKDFGLKSGCSLSWILALPHYAPVYVASLPCLSSPNAKFGWSYTHVRKYLGLYNLKCVRSNILYVGSNRLFLLCKSIDYWMAAILLLRMMMENWLLVYTGKTNKDKGYKFFNRNSILVVFLISCHFVVPNNIICCFYGLPCILLPSMKERLPLVNPSNSEF